MAPLDPDWTMWSWAGWHVAVTAVALVGGVVVAGVVVGADVVRGAVVGADVVGGAEVTEVDVFELLDPQAASNTLTARTNGMARFAGRI